jgi:hypothetical protein
MSETTRAEQPEAPRPEAPQPHWVPSAEFMAAVSLLAFFLYLIALVVSQRGGGLTSISGIATALLGAITNPSSKVAVPRVEIFQRQLNAWLILVAAGVLSTVVAAIFLFPAGYPAAGGAFVAAGAGLAGLLVDTSSAASALRAVARRR